MRTLVRDDRSQWCEVTREVPQGSVSASIMLSNYVNDMTDERSFYIRLPADGAKLMKVKDQMDYKGLQSDLEKIY